MPRLTKSARWIYKLICKLAKLQFPNTSVNIIKVPQKLSLFVVVKKNFSPQAFSLKSQVFEQRIQLIDLNTDEYRHYLADLRKIFPLFMNCLRCYEKYVSALISDLR